MSEDGGDPRRGFLADDEPTRVRGDVLPSFDPDDVPPDSVPPDSGSLPELKQTRRLRVGEHVDRRALPFRKNRERRDDDSDPPPSADERPTRRGGRSSQEEIPMLAATGAMRPLKYQEAALPFDDSGEIPPDQPTIPRDVESATPEDRPTIPRDPAIKHPPMHLDAAPQSVWGARDITVNPADLPSALAPISTAPAPLAKKSRIDPMALVVFTACVLVVLMCAVVLLL
jgi:hypothetical protein